MNRLPLVISSLVAVSAKGTVTVRHGGSSQVSEEAKKKEEAGSTNSKEVAQIQKPPLSAGASGLQYVRTLGKFLDFCRGAVVELTLIASKTRNLVLENGAAGGTGSFATPGRSSSSAQDSGTDIKYRPSLKD